MHKPVVKGHLSGNYSHLYQLVARVIHALIQAGKEEQAVIVLLGWQKLTKATDVVEMLRQYVDIVEEE
jgi:hypothetical protein